FGQLLRNDETTSFLALAHRASKRVHYSRSMRVRLVELGDAAAIAAIYNAEVAEPAVTFDLVPRSVDQQGEWIERHQGAHPALVAVDDAPGDAERIVGFASLSAFRGRPAYATS